MILPWCNIAAMELFLLELTTRVAPGRHAVLLLDQAGWHISERLTVPSNITIMALPAATKKYLLEREKLNESVVASLL